MLKFVTFRPKLEGFFRERFYLKASEIYNISNNEIEKIVLEELTWVDKLKIGDISQRKKYRAIWLFLRDLIRAAWKPNFTDGKLELSLPSLDTNKKEVNLSDKKNELRTWMLESRNERLNDYEVFIKKMENNSSHKKRIQNLICSGDELYQRINNIKSGEPIKNNIDPYLQIVNDDYDEYTGFKLSEIWRYFRLTWSTPSENTPGRTIQYLIRDKAAKNHAIMGIASLENCAMQIKCRDDFIGWSVNSIIEKIENYNGDKNCIVQDVIESLLSYIQESIQDIDYSDLNITTNAIESPSLKDIQDLEIIASDAEATRIEYSKVVDDEKSLNEEQINKEKSDLGSISKDVEYYLYKRKRADQLAKNLNAKYVLLKVFNDENYFYNWSQLISTEIGFTVLRTAIIARKSQHIGTSMMELNVCGAVQPYNEILSGKLVAMLALSPQVVNDYAIRYGDRRSEIASRLKGTDVIRQSDLVYIGTTSLYYVGSSQYNRIKIPGSIFDVNNKEKLEWLEVGATLGYGTMHLSKATTQSFSDVYNEKFKKINHVFGEGSSPKMRLMTSTLREILEVNQDEFKSLCKHAMSRIVYSAPLISNLYDYFMGFNVKPKYIFNGIDTLQGTQKIIDFWINRWLLSRIKYQPALERIKIFDKENYLVSKYINNNNNKWLYKRLKEEEFTYMSQYNIDFIRKLYRGTSSFADNTNIDDLNTFHIRTKLDDSILEDLTNKKDVVLTGNPGDGKTHIIRILCKKIEQKNINVKIELDASTKTNEQIYQEWKLANDNNMPFCIAINAAILLNLYKTYKEFQPINTAYKIMMNSITYKDEENNSTNICVYDLSKRIILTKDITKTMIDKFTANKIFSKCNECPNHDQCDALRNKSLLRTTIFQERLQLIFDRINIVGYHVTLRELQSLISYLIFSGKDCSELSRDSGKDKNNITSLLYNGKGNLFDLIRNSFDPIKVCHPLFDEQIIRNSFIENSWNEVYGAPKEMLDYKNIDRFNLMKRNFYFFNENGNELLKISDDFVTKFNKLLQSESKQIINDLFKKINAFFNDNEVSSSFSIWEGFRYDFSPRKILLSTKKVEKKDFEILIPRLNYNMKKGIDYVKNYVLLSYKNNDKNINLIVDYDMYKMFLQVNSGIPMLYMENETVKKVWRFIEKLKDDEINDLSNVNIKLMDVYTKRSMDIIVDLDDKKYLSIESGK